MSCADIDCRKISLVEAALDPLARRCCPHGSRAITPAKKKSQGQKDVEEFVKGKNPTGSSKNTSKDTRNIIEKVSQEGTSAGGKIPAGGVGGKSAGEDPGENPASGCPNPGDGDILGAIWKPLCELGHGAQAGTENNIPMIAIGIGAVIVLFMVIK